MSDERAIRIERADGWASVILDRPERKNAMTGPMMDQLADALDELSADESVAAIVLRGADGAFSSGVDLTELQRDPAPDWVAHFSASVRRAHISLYRCACPIIVALERYSINGSTALAVAGDLVVAGESSFMQIGEIRQGARMPMNAAWMLIKSTETVLARMALMGDRVAAGDLLGLGLVHEVVADGGVLARAEELAAQMASYPAGSARGIKSEVRARSDIDPETWFSSSVANSALLTAGQVRD